MRCSPIASWPGVRHAIYLTIIAAVTGLAANAINPRGIAIRCTASQPLHEVDLSELRNGEKPPLLGTVQVRQLADRGGALFIDARTASEYAAGHIAGAINIPYEELFAHLEVINALPREPWLICYCDGPPCDLSHLLAMELVNMGFVRVAIYEPGLEAWQQVAATSSAEEAHHD